MTRFVNIIVNQLLRAGGQKLDRIDPPMTREQKAAQKRVRKVMRNTRRINRI